MVIVLLASCGLTLSFYFGGKDYFGDRGYLGDKRRTAAPAGAESDGFPSAAPTGPTRVGPLDPDEYQALLTETDQALATGFRSLGAAKSPQAVHAAASNVSLIASDQRQTLAGVTPPPGVASAHSELVGALYDLANALDETGSAAESNEVCLGSAAVARVSRDAALDRFRAEVRALATADPTQAYRLGSFVPAKTKDGNRRLGNGSYLKRTRGGSGQLKIKNGGTDTVVSIVRGKTAVTRVYLRGKNNFTVHSIADGTYQIFVTSGVDWDNKLKAFARNCGFEKFDDSLKFTTTSRTYTGWTISLYSVKGGNASTSRVDPEDFPGD
jgi:hypothetical protein